LRPAQHFHVLDVEEFLLEEVVADEGNVVEGDGDGRIGGGGMACVPMPRIWML